MSIEFRTPIVFLLARPQRLAYLQVPKVACTSMRAALCLLARPEIPREKLLERRAFAKHPEWSEIVLPDDPFVRECFRFTFVRNPYERFASFYRSKVGRRTQEQIKPHFIRMGVRAGMSIEEVFTCVENAPRETLDPHVAPQSYFVFADGMPRVEYIGRLEQLSTGLDEIAAKSGVRLEVPRLNVTDGAEVEPRQVLSADLKKRLAAFYAEDFARFSYDA